MIKQALLVVGVIVVLSIVTYNLGTIYGNGKGTPRGGNETNCTIACYNDTSCTEANYVSPFCVNSSYCVLNMNYRCIYAGTYLSQCILNGTIVRCYPCENGCFNGSCIPPVRMSDLIVQDINFTISNSTENVSVYVVVKNIGNASAGASKTQLAHSGTVLQLFDIHLLNPGQVVVHGPAYVMVARGTTYQLQAKADVLNSVVESNETNNDLSVSIVMPP